MYLTTLKVVIPMGIMMLTGYLTKRANLTSQQGEKMVNNIVYWIFMPCLVFYSIVTCSDINLIDGHFFAIVAAAIGVSILGTTLLLKRLRKEMRVAMLIGICRTNMSVYGSAISLGMLSAGEAKLAMLYLSFGVAIQNLFLVTTLEIMEGNKVSPLRTILRVLSNPQIIATVSALLFNLLHIELPEVILSPIESLSKCATPVAFLMLGVGFELSKDNSENMGIIAVVVSRLLIIPLLLLVPITVVFQINGMEKIVLCCILASPCAVSSLPLSNQFGGNKIITNESIVYTSVLSIVTFPIFVSLCDLVTRI